MGVYKHDVVVVIKMGAKFMGCLFCMGAYYPDFTVCSLNRHTQAILLTAFIASSQMFSFSGTKVERFLACILLRSL